MKIEHIFTDDEAVSPVIGVILMVAITVILAAVIGTFVLGLGGDNTQTPQTRFDYKYNNVPNELNLSIEGGTTLDPENTGVPEGCNVQAIKITGLNATPPNPTNYPDLQGSGSTGGYLCWDASGDGLKATAMKTVPVTPGAEVKLIWKTPNGDRTQILDTFPVPSSG